MLVSVVLRAITVGLRIGYLASVISFGVVIIQDFGDDCFGVVHCFGGFGGCGLSLGCRVFGIAC